MPGWVSWVLLIGCALLCSPRSVRASGARIGAVLDNLAQRFGPGEAVVCAAALLLGAVPTLLRAVPPPSTHDEFAYLLAAQTFVQGRLTNPTHLLWEHLETFHQIMQPTYMAKFPPGQGLALAAGMLLGAPIIGAWGLVAFACAAICWMIRGPMPDRWAIVGGLVAATHPLVFWWGQIYWGGGVALLGGALLTGAFLRSRVRPMFRWGFAGGVGAAILANSRPFEGALVTLILLSLLASAALRRGSVHLLALRLVIPAAIVLAPVGAWMMYYNWRVSGNALTMPYVVHARQYMMSPLLWLQQPPPRPEYRHAKLEQYYAGYEFHEYARQRPGQGFFRYGILDKWREIVVHWIDPVTLTLPLVVAGFALFLPAMTAQDRAIAGLSVGICVGFPLLHMLLTPWLRMQYLAPIGGFYILAIAVGLRALAAGFGRGGSAGPALVGATLIVQFIAVGVVMWQMFTNPRPTGAARQATVEHLFNEPGRHLVIVRYSRGPQSIFEWVYNDADIDGSRIVWARDLGQDRNQDLLTYFHDRRTWLLDVDGSHISFREVPRQTLNDDHLGSSN